MLILLCILVVLSSKASEAVENHYVNASNLNLLEAHEAEASLAGMGAYTLTVGLTLIQIAAAKVVEYKAHVSEEQLIKKIKEKLASFYLVVLSSALQ
ncbi:hypothetical protein S245_007941, partial [Arachis hypogaea]